MSAKSRRSAIALIVLISMCFGIASSRATPVIADNPSPQALVEKDFNNLQIEAAKEGVVVSVTEESLRYKELKRVLGDNAPSKKEFDSWTPQQFRDFVTTHSNQLGVQVWKTYVDKDGKVQSEKIAGPDKIEKKPDAKIEPKKQQITPYPEPNDDIRQGTQTLFVLNNKVYVPAAINGRSRVDELKSRMDESLGYLTRTYESDATYGYLKDYPSCPLSIKANWDSSKYKYRMPGQYLTDHAGTVVMLGYTTVGPDYMFTDFAFQTVTPIKYYDTWEDWKLEAGCDVAYGLDGTATYQVQKLAWYTSNVDDVSVLLGDLTVISNAYLYPVNTPVTVTLTNGAIFPSHRFALRHSEQLGFYVYSSVGDTGKATKLSQTLGKYGIYNPHDIYGPAFGFETGQPVDYMYSTTAYYDCTLTWQGMNSTVEFGMNPHRYGYESKVCTIPGAVTAYITLSRLDYLVTALQAIHVLNVTNNPDYSYPDPANPLLNTTPRQMARRIEANGWNGRGIAAFQKDPAYASAIRTNVFAILEVRLGYVFNDATSRGYADAVEEILLQTQWGMAPFEKYTGVTAQSGMLQRNGFQGSQLLSWGQGANGYEYQLPPYGFINGLVDEFNMPNESVDAITSNPETTATFWAAMRFILKDKYDVIYPAP